MERESGRRAGAPSSEVPREVPSTSPDRPPTAGTTPTPTPTHVPGRTRGSAFPDALVEAGFWCVLGSSRGLYLPPDIGEGCSAELIELVTPVLNSEPAAAPDPRRIVALVEVTRNWAREQGSAGTISAAGFDRARRELLDGWGVGAGKGALVWPPTSRTVAVRLGGGSWSGALEALGVATSSRGRVRGGERSGTTPHVLAVARFLEEAGADEGPTTFLAYTDWARGQRDAGNRVPAPATIRQHFGSWSAALQAARDHMG